MQQSVALVKMLQNHAAVFDSCMTPSPGLHPTVVRTQLAETLEARCERNRWRVKMPVKASGQPSEAETRPIALSLKQFEDDIGTWS